MRLFGVLLFGCSGGKDVPDTSGDDDDVVGDDDDDTAGNSDGTTPGDDDDDATSPCDNEVIEQYPENSQIDVYYKTEVRYTLALPDETATITITDANGDEIAGTTSVVDRVVSWNGEDRAPNSSYVATLTYCDTLQSTWTTSDVGAPVGVDLEGDVFGLALAGGQWVQPAGIGAILASQLGETQLLVSPLSIGTSTLTPVLALGEADVQELCSPTIALPPADWLDPYFSIETSTLPLIVAGFSIDIDNASISGAFAPDGSRIQGVTLAGDIDTRPLGEVFGLGTANTAVCDLVTTFGVPCVSCADGSGDYCLEMRADNIEAPLIDGVTIEIRTEEDIASDPDCN